MRRRNHPVIVRLNDKEFIQLKDNVAKTSLSQEAYLRTVIAGNIPKERPPVEYHNLLRELRGIGRNINQICARLNAYGGMDADAYHNDVNMLHKVISEMRTMFELPEKQA